MTELLFISKRNSHGKYFRKLSTTLSLNSDIHFIGFPKLSAIGHLGVFPTINIEDICMSQLSRKRQSLPKLFKYNIVCKIYLSTLKLIERCRVAKYTALFSELNPDKIAIWNGDKLPYRTIAEVATLCNIEVVYFENGLLPKTTTIDFNGVNEKNSLPRNPKFYRDYATSINTAEECFTLNQRSLHKKRKRHSPIVLPEKFIFVPFQVPNDTQIVVNSPWIKSMEQLYRLLIKTIKDSKLKGYTLVFKVHPSWPSDFSHLIDQSENAIFANQNDTQELITKAKAVITINSTVGIESLLMNTPVLTLGKACYNIKQLVLHADTEDELIKELNELESWQPDQEVRKGFIQFLKNEYTVPDGWNSPHNLHFEAADLRINKKDRYHHYVSNAQFY